MRVWTLAGLLVVGCGDKDTTESDTAGADAETSNVAPLAELSSGECPDMSASGTTSSFLSSGEDRTATLIFPEDTDRELSVVFFFHGLMDPASTPEPTSYMASALDAQVLADEQGAIIVMPESPIQAYFGLEFFLWNVEEGKSESDLVLYDDLRTCVTQQFETVSLDRVFAMGFSGGALFTTIVASQRGDTLAAIVEMSGGSDLEVSLAEGEVASYDTPAYTMPALLATGGTNDVWPSPDFPIVDFVAGTDTLEASLVADGHYTVRCRHERGHTITNAELELAVEWVSVHRFEEPSPYLSSGLGSDEDWCVVASE